jgi:hypothetical protein
LNACWVQAANRISPELLIELLEMSNKMYAAYLRQLDPESEAIFSVAWAGEQRSRNGFHIAREYTEKWHHQQQIRVAVNQGNVLLAPRWYRPFLETVICALPWHYRSVAAREGYVIRVEVGDELGTWYMAKEVGGWTFISDAPQAPDSEIRIQKEVAWRLFTQKEKGPDIWAGIEITGGEIAGAIRDVIAVMA